MAQEKIVKASSATKLWGRKCTRRERWWRIGIGPLKDAVMVEVPRSDEFVPNSIAVLLARKFKRLADRNQWLLLRGKLIEEKCFGGSDRAVLSFL